MKNSFRKRIISFVLIAALVITMIPSNVSQVYANSVLAYGTCGEDVNWTYNVKGELRISGYGEMYDYSGQNAPWHSSDYYDDVKKIIISDDVTKLGDYAFNGFTGLTSIQWGADVEEIGNWTFARCSNLTSVTIPDSVDTIGDYAFYLCERLESVYMKSSGIKMTENSFGLTTWYDELPDLYVYDKYLLVKCKSEYGGTVKIPEGVTYIGPYSIQEGIFNEVIFPSSLETIKTGVLTGIRNVTIPATVKTLESHYGAKTSGIETITIEGDFENVPDKVFGYASNATPTLTTVIFKEGVTTIYSKMFTTQQSIRTVSLPDTLIEIQSGAFNYCTSLNYIRIPGSVKTIGDQAFWSTGLTAVEICDGVEVIDDYAFLCRGLTEINIPGSVKEIGEYAIGYYDVTSSGGKKTSGFVIHGHEGSAAQKYAEENGFTFKTVPHELKESIVKATPNSDGEIKNACACGYSESTRIPAFTKVELQYAETAYDGSAKTPTAKLYDCDGRNLAKDIAYTVSYKNNVNAGTATVVVTGIGDYYSGTIEKTFKINPVAINSATVYGISDQVYTGKAVTPEPAVTLGGKVLVKGTDYTVAYQNNTDPGTATVKITGKGNYSGTINSTFKIIKSTASEPATPAPEQPTPEQPAPNDPTPEQPAPDNPTPEQPAPNDPETDEPELVEPVPQKITSVKLSASSFVYNGKARKPAVTVKVGNEVIAKNITKDNGSLEITYSAGRKNIGTYTVTVEGIDEYTGKITKTFTIKPKAPTLKAKAAGKRKVSLTIGNSKGATGYEIYVKEPGKKKFTLQSKIVKSGAKYKLYAKSGKKWKFIKKLNNRTVKNANLKKGKTYKYKVKAYATVKGKTYYSGFSAVKSAKVK